MLFARESSVLALLVLAACAKGDAGDAARDLGVADVGHADVPDLGALPDMASVLDAMTAMDMEAPVDMAVDEMGIDMSTMDASTGCLSAAMCDDRIACTVDTCESGVCEHFPNAGSCDDGNSCTVDSCSTAGRGGCRYLTLGAGAACDDESLCTINDVCDGSMLAPRCIGTNACPDCLCNEADGSCGTCS